MTLRDSRYDSDSMKSSTRNVGPWIVTVISTVVTIFYLFKVSKAFSAANHEVFMPARPFNKLVNLQS